MLAKAFKDDEAAVALMGHSIANIGMHSIRKGAISYKCDAQPLHAISQSFVENTRNESHYICL